MLTNSDRLEIALKASVAAGNLLCERAADDFKCSIKESMRDVVTEIDIEAEKTIIDILNKLDPNCQIFTEEQGFISSEKQEDYWVVDALDGTVNYINHIPFFCVSIAYLEKGKPILGAIYNPVQQDLYYGAEGIGIFCNESKIRVKDKKPEESLFAVSFSGKNHDPNRRIEEFLRFERVNDTSRGCLRTGSAALNIAYVARGQFAGCWGKANYIWDVAAGLLFAKMAGAKVEYKYLNYEKKIISYIVAVPSAWEYLTLSAKLW